MNLLELKEFLIASNKAGYAGGEEKKWIKEPDGSTTIPYEKGDWKSHDNFFGGEPYGGRIVVFNKNLPVWMMVYYGWVAEGNESNPIYGVIRAEFVSSWLLTSRVNSVNLQEYSLVNYVYTKES